jgi:hypothetical protein
VFPTVRLCLVYGLLDFSLYADSDYSDYAGEWYCKWCREWSAFCRLKIIVRMSCGDPLRGIGGYTRASVPDMSNPWREQCKVLPLTRPTPLYPGRSHFATQSTPQKGPLQQQQQHHHYFNGERERATHPCNNDKPPQQAGRTTRSSDHQQHTHQASIPGRFHRDTPTCSQKKSVRHG